MQRIKVLLTKGSFNQTTQMYQIARALPPDRIAVWFTPSYAEGLLGWCPIWRAP